MFCLFFFVLLFVSLFFIGREGVPAQGVQLWFNSGCLYALYALVVDVFSLKLKNGDVSDVIHLLTVMHASIIEVK